MTASTTHVTTAPAEIQPRPSSLLPVSHWSAAVLCCQGRVAQGFEQEDSVVLLFEFVTVWAVQGFCLFSWFFPLFPLFLFPF